MTPEQIEQELAQLRKRLEEVEIAGTRCAWSRDIFNLEQRLSRRWNFLIEELNQAGAKHDYKPRVIVEADKPVALTWIQELFVETGMTPADLARKDEPKRSDFGDGMDWMLK